MMQVTSLVVQQQQQQQQQQQPTACKKYDGTCALPRFVRSNSASLSSSTSSSSSSSTSCTVRAILLSSIVLILGVSTCVSAFASSSSSSSSSSGGESVASSSSVSADGASHTNLAVSSTTATTTTTTTTSAIQSSSMAVSAEGDLGTLLLEQHDEDGKFSIPSESGGTRPCTEYPNPLQITASMRRDFHAVVIFPLTRVSLQDNPHPEGMIHEEPRGHKSGSAGNYTVLVPDYQVQNHSASLGQSELLTPEEYRLGKYLTTTVKKDAPKFTVGRHDEHRPLMYSSDMFLADDAAPIDGYSGRQRTLHMGIDLGAPVGSKVYAFCDGVVHSAGFNPDLGDYGYVIVVEHTLPAENPPKNTNDDDDDDNDESSTSRNLAEQPLEPRKVWALYGHLDARSIRGKVPGKVIHRGQVLGHIGSPFENGGWTNPHVHFQLSLTPPQVPHDLPGVVALQDRHRALIQYPDPRWVLGDLY